MGSGEAMLGARYIVGESFDRLEHERAEREGERARRVLNQQHRALTATARDYSYWIDAVQFVSAIRPSFLQDSFDAESLGYLGVSEVVVFDVTGQVHGSIARLHGRSSHSKTEQLVSESLVRWQELCASGNRLTRLVSETSPTAAVTLLRRCRNPSR